MTVDAQPQAPDAAGEAEPTIEVPLRADVLETRGAAEESERLRAHGRRRRRARRALALAVAVAVAGAAFVVGGQRTRREIDEHVAAADARLADGRLTGGDAALDHLVAARTLDPGDLAVRERLRLVADKLEQLGEAAAARGDLAEAAIHLTAAAQAEPDRQRVHVRLGEIARGQGPERPAADGARR